MKVHWLPVIPDDEIIYRRDPRNDAWGWKVVLPIDARLEPRSFYCNIFTNTQDTLSLSRKRDALRAEIDFNNGRLFWAACSQAMFFGESFEVARDTLERRLIEGDCSFLDKPIEPYLAARAEEQERG